MSYLDFPRINFSGLFQALPSTINNSPLNYRAERWNQDPKNPNQPTDEIALFWSPNGTGIFDLVECQVQSIQRKDPDGQQSSGTQQDLLGVPVLADYTKAPPKIVDLDPMQQGVSEVWGMTVRIGHSDGPHVIGTFAPIAFNDLWTMAQGPEAPRSSASASAVYQSSLTNLQWQEAGSPTLEALKKISPSRLSIRMVVNAFNSNPQEYLFDSETLHQVCTKGKVPKEVVQKLDVLKTYRQQPTAPHGQIPTSSYVLLQLRLILGEESANQYGDVILQHTQQPPVASTPNEFGYGSLIGSVGPATKVGTNAAEVSEASQQEEGPLYVVPARTLAAPQSTESEQGSSLQCFSSPAKLHSEEGILTVDLGNSLPVNFPGDSPWEKLGSLTLAYSPQPGHFVSIAEDIPYAAASGLLPKQSGIVDVRNLPNSVVQELEHNPLVLLGTSEGQQTVLLMEDRQGFSMRADQFVYRMNPALKTSSVNPRGDTADLKVYVRKFGQVAGTEGYEVQCSVLSPEQALSYTGSRDTSTPSKGLEFDIGSALIENGVASFQLKANDPGMPRDQIDGQVYLAQYFLSQPSGEKPPTNSQYLVSVHVYTDTQIDSPTWENGIQEILTQYGRLYPIMTNIGLSNLETVKKNAGMIRHVLSLDFDDPLHMPVTRDLSESRRKILLKWLEQFIPKS